VGEILVSRSSAAQSPYVGNFQFHLLADHNPEAMLSVMRVLKEAGAGGRQSEFLSAHPLPETRLQEIGDYLRTAYPEGMPSNLSLGRRLSR
jgi:predicted Zn-dependent protease